VPVFPENGATSLGATTKRSWLHGGGAGKGLPLPPGLFLADALQGAEVDQHVDEGVAVGDSRAVTQFGAFDAQFHRLAVDALGGGALLVDLFVGRVLAVELVAQACSGAGGEGRGAAALGRLLVVAGTRLSRFLGEKQWAGVAAALVLHEAAAVDEGVLERHRQPGRAQGPAIRGKGFAMAPALDKGDGRKALCTGLIEVLVNVEGVEGGVKGAVVRAKAQPALDLAQQREKVGDVGAVKGLGQLGQHELAPAGDLGGDNARGVAPVELADGDGVRGAGIAGRGRRFRGGHDLVVPPLAAQAAVGIAFGLAGLVVAGAVLEVGFGIVLLHPGQDVFGIQRDALAKVVDLAGEFGLQQADGVVEEELQGGIGTTAQQAGEMAVGR